MKKIIGMTFPRQDTSLGLEPSLLTVLPEGDNVIYSMENIDFNDEEVENYACSVYITGMNEFKDWASRHDREKIIVGGYEPTINPEEFVPYAKKVMVGPCDDWYQSINQEGNIIKGITNNKKIPRYDLYDIRNNQQIIPDKKKDDICTSINTSQGCPFKCDFCCSPLMCDKLMSKPLELIQKEVAYLKQFNPKFVFIRDENFPLQKDWEKRLQLIKDMGAKIYLFASANLINEETVSIMKENNVYMVCLGLEDITVNYSKNQKLDAACNLLHDNDIMVYLSFIVNPLKIKTQEESNEFYSKLLDRFVELRPEMVCGNFLMPFRGTKIWDLYKDLIEEEDYNFYNSKSAFLEKDKENRQRMEYEMFYYQWLYYTSDFYRENVRTFQTEDTLHLRFLELNEQFKKTENNKVLRKELKSNVNHQQTSSN